MATRTQDTRVTGTTTRAFSTGWDADCGPLDQRGVTRPLDGDGSGGARCDIGAFEFER